jgi:hypothetical protein
MKLSNVSNGSGTRAVAVLAACPLAPGTVRAQGVTTGVAGIVLSETVAGGAATIAIHLPSGATTRPRLGDGRHRSGRARGPYW